MLIDRLSYLPIVIFSLAALDLATLQVQAETPKGGVVVCTASRVSNGEYDVIYHTTRSALEYQNEFPERLQNSKFNLFPSIAELGNALRFFNHSAAFIDYDIIESNGLQLGVLGRYLELDSSFIRECELILELDMCPNPENPQFYRPC